jgi:hypothetical protein
MLIIMKPCNVFDTILITGDDNPPPRPDNDNWHLMHDWRTPAEFLQWVRRRKERLRREVEADERLLACPEHRLTRDVATAMEKCCLWHYFGVR